jgi:predicted transcriptional regulator
MDQIEQDAETLARHLINLATNGKGMPQRIVSCCNIVGLPARRITAARRHLIRSKRLIFNNLTGIIPSIDGIRFGERKVMPGVEVIKDTLRRFYSPVVDLRTVRFQDAVAVGEPEALIVGTQLLSYEQAVELAHMKAARHGMKLPSIAGPRVPQNRASGGA